MRHYRSTRRSRRGAQILEFCFVLPLMVFLVLFSFDMSRLLMTRGVMLDATYRAARAGATVGDANVRTIRTGQLSVTQAAFEEILSSAPLPADVREGATVAVVRNCNDGGSAASSYVTVRSNYTYHWMTPGIGQFAAMALGGALDLGNATPQSNQVSVRCEVVR